MTTLHDYLFDLVKQVARSVEEQEITSEDDETLDEMVSETIHEIVKRLIE